MKLLQPGEDPALPGAVRPPAPSVTLPRTAGCASAQREALLELSFESAARTEEPTCSKGRPGTRLPGVRGAFPDR